MARQLELWNDHIPDEKVWIDGVQHYRTPSIARLFAERAAAIRLQDALPRQLRLIGWVLYQGDLLLRPDDPNGYYCDSYYAQRPDRRTRNWATPEHAALEAQAITDNDHLPLPTNWYEEEGRTYLVNAKTWHFLQTHRIESAKRLLAEHGYTVNR